MLPGSDNQDDQNPVGIKESLSAVYPGRNTQTFHNVKIRPAVQARAAMGRRSVLAAIQGWPLAGPSILRYHFARQE
jgi:hypothetical protein